MKIVYGLAIMIIALAFLGGCTNNEIKSAPSDSETAEKTGTGALPLNPEKTGGNSDTAGETAAENTAIGNTVEITKAGFSPKTLTVKTGAAVTFVNKDSQAHWPASAVHPTHKAYPGSDIAKCNTAEESQIFDACRGLKQQESYSFTFGQAGSWKYHDHFNPGSTGTIVVE